jgi:hypothetical protein
MKYFDETKLNEIIFVVYDRYNFNVAMIMCVLIEIVSIVILFISWIGS